MRPKYPDFNFLINGDFYDHKERSDFVERTKVDGVLLGRPALYNTSIFSTTETRPLVDKMTVVQEYLRKSVRYDTHYKNAKYVICEMMSHRRTPAVRVPYLPMKLFPGGQTIATTCNCNDLQSMCKIWDINYSDAVYAIPDTCTGGSNSNTHVTKVTTDIDGTNHNYTGVSLNAGEHKYEDSYFLKNKDVNGVAGVDERKAIDNKLNNGRETNKNDDNDGDHYQQKAKRAKFIKS